MNKTVYRPPTAIERAFLRVITQGYPDFERQVETCEVGPYDVVGFWPVRMIDPPASSLKRGPLLGPVMIFESAADIEMLYERPHMCPQPAMVEVLFWADKTGVLEEIICTAGDGYIADPWDVSVTASDANAPTLTYRVASNLP